MSTRPQTLKLNLDSLGDSGLAMMSTSPYRLARLATGPTQKESPRWSKQSAPWSKACPFPQVALPSSSRLTRTGSASVSPQFAKEGSPALGRKLALRRALNFLAPPLKATPAAADMPPCPKKTRKSNSKKKCTRLPTTADAAPNTTAAPPVPNAAPPPPPRPAHPREPAPCPVRTHDDSLTFILDTYVTLISPHMTHRPNSNASLIAIRRNIYRKQFNGETLRLIHVNNSPNLSIDDLVGITHLACTPRGLILI